MHKHVTLPTKIMSTFGTRVSPKGTHSVPQLICHRHLAERRRTSMTRRRCNIPSFGPVASNIKSDEGKTSMSNTLTILKTLEERTLTQLNKALPGTNGDSSLPSGANLRPSTRTRHNLSGRRIPSHRSEDTGIQRSSALHDRRREQGRMFREDVWESPSS
jgi:hypothetical protein